MRKNAPGIQAPPPKGLQRAFDRESRKAGQLHGDDRRAYAAAKAQGRGQSFMRNFQRDAGQNQQMIQNEAQRAGLRPPPGQGPPQGPPPGPPQGPPPPPQNMNPGGGGMPPLPWQNLQPFPRPLTGGGQPPEGQFGPIVPYPGNIDPNFNNWAQPQPPGGGMAYMGGSPNFNESTGQYMQPGRQQMMNNQQQWMQKNMPQGKGTPYKGGY